MEQIRLIHFYKEENGGTRESVVFTADYKSNASDWCPRGMGILTDKIIDADLPDSFPLEHLLSR